MSILFSRQPALSLGALLVVWALFMSGCDTPKPAASENDKPVTNVPRGDGPGRFWAVDSNDADAGNAVDFDSFSVAKDKEKNVKWKADLGSEAFGGPAIADGRIFVGTNNNKPRDPKIKGDKGVLMCFKESDGTFLWQIVHNKLENQTLDAPVCGIASRPAVDGDRLYYVSNRCELICADVNGDPDNPGKGKIIWSLDMIEELKVYPGGLSGGLANCSPLVLDDLVYVITSNGASMETQKVPYPEAPSFLAVDKTSGKPVWQSDLPGKAIMDGQWGSPVAAEVNGKKQVIFPGGDGWIYGFEAKSGDLLWKFDCNPKNSSYKKKTRNYLVATPVVHDGKVYIGVGREPDEGTGIGHFWCVDLTKTPKNKDKDLSPVDNKFDPKDPVNKDSGLVWHFGGDAPEGSELPYYFGRTVSTVAIHDGLVYATDLDGFLYCLDAKTGEKYWSHDLSSGTWSSPQYVNGKVYIGITNGTGDLFMFTAGKQKKDPIKIETGEPLKVPVVAAHGVLYLNRGDALFAIAPK
jgi:outer membrane protein assembly factor BamB